MKFQRKYIQTAPDGTAKYVPAAEASEEVEMTAADENLQEVEEREEEIEEVADVEVRKYHWTDDLLDELNRVLAILLAGAMDFALFQDRSRTSLYMVILMTFLVTEILEFIGIRRGFSKQRRWILRFIIAFLIVVFAEIFIGSKYPTIGFKDLFLCGALGFFLSLSTLDNDYKARRFLHSRVTGQLTRQPLFLITFLVFVVVFSLIVGIRLGPLFDQGPIYVPSVVLTPVGLNNCPKGVDVAWTFAPRVRIGTISRSQEPDSLGQCPIWNSQTNSGFWAKPGELTLYSP